MLELFRTDQCILLHFLNTEITVVILHYYYHYRVLFLCDVVGTVRHQKNAI
jgi:hypothetical protein